MTAEAKQKYKIARREEMRADYTIDQRWEDYSDDDHAIWRELFEQVSKSIEGRACREYIEGLKEFGDLIGAEGVPKFDRLSDVLDKKTGWRIVAVPGAIPGSVFFNHLANRRFPVTDWIRSREQMGYLQEPDAFHDITGHVPLLLNPVFADYMEAFGKGGVRAKDLGGLIYLGRLYWYTVEFGLIKSKRDHNQLRIYGAGILSSTEESRYSLESHKPQRVAFNMERMMRTDFHITDLQELYFVVDSFEQLFEATQEDFASYYEKLAGSDAYTPQDKVADDVIIHI
jgi:phenylalanine-4-hydroxylase